MANINNSPLIKQYIVKQCNGFFYISKENYHQYSDIVIAFDLNVNYDFYRKTIKSKYNAIISDSYRGTSRFTSKKDAENALDWINSMHVLSNLS